LHVTVRKKRKMADQPHDLLTPEEVAGRLHQTLRGLQHWRSSGKGPAWVKLGRRVLYPAATVDQFVRELAAEARTTVRAS
jgi:hypothetical protein